MNEDMKVLAFSMPRFLMMSCCTLGVAEAVRVRMGTSSRMALMASRRRRYSGRKSWPHSEIQ